MSFSSENETAAKENRIQIRQIKDGDFEILRDIYLNTRRQTFIWKDPSAFHLEDFDQDTCGEIIRTAECEGQTAGFISIYEPESFVHCLYVAPAFQGKGIGRQLLSYAADTFPLPLSLKCLKRNEKALAFYKSCGFSAAAEGGEGEDAFVLLKLTEQMS